ncbi:MAG: hypothetical protein KDC84_00675 [Crocinitomicaceae bacterium]|nr:hypothetical protein [Crocinitomicaceae bacterium]
MSFLASIPNSVIWWLYPLIMTLFLIFVRKSLHLINPKTLVKIPPPLDAYVILYMTKKDAEVIHRIVQNLIEKGLVEYHFSQSNTIGVKRLPASNEQIENLHPLENFVYQRMKSEYMDYLSFLKEHGYGLERAASNVIDRYKQNWLNAGLMFPKSRLKLQNGIYIFASIIFFVISIMVAMSRGENDKMVVAIFVEMTLLIIGLFIIAVVFYHPRLTPKGKKYIQNTRKDLENKQRSPRENFILASLDEQFILSEKIKKFREYAAIQRPFPIAVSTEKKDLDESIPGVGVDSCSSCDSCSCSE